MYVIPKSSTTPTIGTTIAAKVLFDADGNDPLDTK